MTSPHRTTARLLACAAILALSVVLPPVAAAQEAEPPRPFCGKGRPASACRAFLVAHLNYFPDRDDDRTAAEPWSLMEWEVGGMANLAPGHAVGAALAVGTSDTGFHAALKGRYRRWLTGGVALDAGAGFLVTQHPPRTYPHDTLAGVTADAALGLTDWVAVSGRAYLLGGAVGGGHLSGAEVGVRVGTGPGLVVTVLGLGAMLRNAMNAP
ncbi:MAG TPA: hypothetical protein VFY65_02585 [Longimicrobium sp.]|nr:hypothetical protein [Longimicrobium sp.]